MYSQKHKISIADGEYFRGQIRYIGTPEPCDVDFVKTDMIDHKTDFRWFAPG
jgi:hypothetical protein